METIVRLFRGALSPAFILISFSNIISQTPQSWTSSEIYQGIRKLKVLGTVLYVAAHPDDENTRLITYLSRDKMYRTGYLSMTRGDGGQNLIGDEQGIELGLIRTQELLAARRIDGGEQFFTRAFDFGYSKTPEETISKWDKEKILGDIVWVIRKFQPDVIITRFPSTGEGGHGHHTASAILANEAFTAAADPNRFPEQLKYVKTWKAKRIMWNTFNFGGRNTTREDQLKINVGGFNPLLGKSYGEIAADGRSQHKSQGFGVPSSRGEAWEYFKIIEGEAPVRELMDGVDVSWRRTSSGEKIEKLLDGLESDFNFMHPERSVTGLIQLYKELQLLTEGYWKTRKLNEVQELIEKCSGLFLDATTSKQFAVLGDSLRVNFSINNRLGVEALLEKVIIEDINTNFSEPLTLNKDFNFFKMIYVNPSKEITQPYWLKEKMAEGYFTVRDQIQIGQPDVDPAFTARITLKIAGESFVFERPVKYKFTDPVKGELYQPVSILPPVELNFTNENVISINNNKARAQVYFKSNREDSVYYSGRIGHSANWAGDRDVFRYGTYRNKANYVSSYLNPVSRPQNTREQLTVQFLNGGNHIYHHYIRMINYDHIPSIVYFKEANANLVKLELNKVGKRIGYITGAGDKVPEALDQMGYEVVLLTEKEMARNNLEQFNAIITGVRAYNTNEWMNNYYE
ncbi:MAG TPA: PIG-L family deacetylase, partial [Chitinophagaceae bacterium]|nr:PIG-L family deacetylase [Chitinophagaceae bacterium]